MKAKEMIYQHDRKLELLFNDIFKGYHYYILNLGTHPTAYIEISKEDKLYGKSYDEIYRIGCDIDVNGGLTYSDNELMGISSDNWFIGWDYAHCGDYCGYEETMPESIRTYGKKWTTEEIIEECKNAIDQIIEFEEILDDEEKGLPEQLDHLIGYDIQQFDDLKEYVEITTNDLFGEVNKVIDTLNQLSDYLKSKAKENEDE